MENSSIKTIRTIGKAVDEIKAQDPNACISAWGLRRLVKSGQIPSAHSGNKTLVCVEDVVEYYSGRIQTQNYQTPPAGGIRPLPVDVSQLHAAR